MTAPTQSILAQGEGWLPIATAPRDGTELLLTAGPSTWMALVVGEFRDGHWLTQPGDFVIRPTHWMPLPPAPAGDA